MATETVIQVQRILTGIAHMAAVVVCFILVLWLYFRIRVKEDKVSSVKLLIYTFCGITLNLLTSLSVVIVGFTTQSKQRLPDELAVISANIFRGAEIFVWLVFIKRLQISFQNTKYRITNKIFFLFYLLILIFILSNIIYTIMYLFHTINAIPLYSYDIDSGINLWLHQIVDLIMTTSLLYLYSNKLFKLNMDIGMNDPLQLKNIERYSIMKSQSQEIENINQHNKRNESVSIKNALFDPQRSRNVKATISMDGAYEYNQHNKEIEDSSSKSKTATQTHTQSSSTTLRLTISFNKGQQKVLKAMSKISVLSALAIIFVQIIALDRATVATLLYLRIITVDDYYYWNGWLIFFWAFGVINNAICMFLSFDFVSKYYYKWCNGLDKCCFNCCKYCSAWKIKNHVIRQTELGAPLLIRESAELL